MYKPRPRVIPCLLLNGPKLVKTVKFSGGTYLGDPRNIVKIFNEKEADELCILDISASKQGRAPDFDLVRQIANESFMPVAYGGGIRCADDAKRIVQIGVEKVIINTHAHTNPSLVTECASILGSQSVVAALDARKRRFRRGHELYSHVKGSGVGADPVHAAIAMQEAGAGEILLTSVDRDGTMEGYDLELIASVAAAVSIPLIACGGASGVNDFGKAVYEAGAAAVSAGSIFVFHGRLRAVLISFPGPEELTHIFSKQVSLPDSL